MPTLLQAEFCCGRAGRCAGLMFRLSVPMHTMEYRQYRTVYLQGSAIVHR